MSELDEEELKATRRLNGADKDIEVGEYVRTNEGIIDKVIIDYKGECNNLNCNRKHISCEKNYYNEDDIINHNKDIGELIGYGDFINGKMCIDIEHYTRDDGTKGINFVCLGGSVLKEHIKEIVTKEQINQVKYEV